MNFKAYDILSSLVPGFLAIIYCIYAFDQKFESNLVVAYTAIAFLFGYFLNTLSSWLEGFYFLTWGGKPSSRLLQGKDIWKVRFFHAGKAKMYLLTEAGNPSATNDELFAIAMRYASGQSRVEDLNALYAFSRVLLTTIFFGSILFLAEHYDSWKAYLLSLPCLFIAWMRCKQRGYYYAREVLNVYLKSKKV